MIRSCGLLLALVAFMLGCNRSAEPATKDEAVAVNPTAPPNEKPAESATGSVERTDLIGRHGKPLTLVGIQPEVGDPAPDFTLKGDKLQDVAFADLAGQVVVLSVVPSIDTRVCEAQTHKISDLEPTLPEGVTVLTISRDLPFAQTRFIEESQMKTKLASDYKSREFGRAWGLEIKETGLLARSVWVVDRSGNIAYRELVADQASEPNYEALVAAVQNVPTK